MISTLTNRFFVFDRASTTLTDNSLPDPVTKLLRLFLLVPRILQQVQLPTLLLLKLKSLNNLNNKVFPELVNT